MAPVFNRIAQVRKEKKLSQAQLGEAVGAHWVTISKLERGVQRLTWPWMQKLAAALGVNTHDLIEGEKYLTSIQVSGVVDFDGILYTYQDDATEIRSVYSSVFDSDTNDWVEVKGDSLWPYFHDGDLISISYTDRENSLFVGRFVRFYEDDGRTLLGILNHGSKYGKWDIHVGTKPPLRDLKGRVSGYVTFAAFDLPLRTNGELMMQNMEARLSYEAEVERQTKASG